MQFLDEVDTGWVGEPHRPTLKPVSWSRRAAERPRSALFHSFESAARFTAGRVRFLNPGKCLTLWK
jgi:hypothetical protein